MTLAAAQVINTLAARLAPMPATSGRVYTSRLWPLTEADLPAWRITAEGEQVEVAELEGVNMHSLTVSAKAYARATADIDDVLDALASSGLALLYSATVPYGLQLESIDRDLATEGEAAVGVITLTSRAIYFVAPGSPETILS
jgi:hypothetical protein